MLEAPTKAVVKQKLIYDLYSKIKVNDIMYQILNFLMFSFKKWKKNEKMKKKKKMVPNSKSWFWS